MKTNMQTNVITDQLTHRLLASAAATALALSLGACASTSDPEAASGSDDNHHLADVLGHLQARSGAVDAVWIEQSMSEMVPAQTFAVDGRAAAPLTSGLVVGRVTEVAPGSGFVNPDDAPTSTVVPFDAPEALWRTVEVTVRPDKSWGKVAGAPTVTFAVTIDKGVDPAAALDGLGALDRIVVALDQQGRYAYDPTLWSISHNGDVFGQVDDQDRISLDAMEEGSEFLGELDTVAELEAKANTRPRPIAVTRRGGLPQRP